MAWNYPKTIIGGVVWNLSLKQKIPHDPSVV